MIPLSTSRDKDKWEINIIFQTLAIYIATQVEETETTQNKGKTATMFLQCIGSASYSSLQHKTNPHLQILKETGHS